MLAISERNAHLHALIACSCVSRVLQRLSPLLRLSILRDASPALNTPRAEIGCCDFWVGLYCEAMRRKGQGGKPLLEHFLWSLGRVFGAFALACVTAVPVGILMGVS